MPEILLDFFATVKASPWISLGVGVFVLYVLPKLAVKFPQLQWLWDALSSLFSKTKSTVAQAASAPEDGTAGALASLHTLTEWAVRYGSPEALTKTTALYQDVQNAVQGAKA